MDPAVDFQPAFIVHTRPYRETSLIIESFTPKYGRVAAVARGALKSKSTRHLYQPFLPVQITWFGKSDLKTLGKIEASGAAIQLKGLTLYLGFYINELILRLVQGGDCHISLFSSYIECIHQLASGVDGEELPLRRFELTLLDTLGYGVNFSHEAATGDAIDANAHYQFVPLHGFSRAKEIERAAQGSKFTPEIVGEQIIDLHNNRFANVHKKLLRNIAREQLAALLGHKPLNSRVMYQQLLQGKRKQYPNSSRID